MSEDQWAIDCATDQTGATISLHLAGRFDGSAHQALRRALRDVFGRTHRTAVIVDVSHVDELDGRCVRSLLAGYTRALRSGNGYEVTGSRGAVGRVLAQAGLNPSRTTTDLADIDTW